MNLNRADSQTMCGQDQGSQALHLRKIDEMQ
jgi:hypothetical protein